MSTTTRMRKAKRDLERKRKQQLYILIGIVVVAVFAFAVVILTQMNFTKDQETAAAIAESSAYDALQPSVSGEEGLPQLGSPDAPVTIHEYSSFGCGHCMNFHDDQFQVLKEDIAAGTVRFVFVPVSNQYSLAASAAAFCAEEQGRFWEMHDVLFSYLGQYGNGAYTADRINAAARALALDDNAFESCLAAEETFTRIDDANALFFALAEQDPNVTGTTTLTFNGETPEWGSGSPSSAVISQKIAEIIG